MGPAADVRARHPGAAVRDLGGAILAPGLVDAHAHLEWSLWDGVLGPQGFGSWLTRFLELRGRMTPEDHLAAVREGVLRALRAGTTTLADSGPTGAGIIAMAEGGMRGTVHLEAFGREEGDEARERAADVAERVEALAAAAHPRNRVGVSPHAPYSVGPALWSALAQDAYLAERPWATHLAESEDEERAIAAGDGPLAEIFARIDSAPGRWPGRDGASPVERLAQAGALRPAMIAAHCVRLGEDDPGRLAAEGVGVAHCPRSNEHLRCGRAPLPALLAAGVDVGLGTDSPGSGGDYDLRAEARACARRNDGAVLDAEALLRLATVGGARVMGLETRVGTLTPGKRADMVALRPAGGADDPYAAALAPATEVAATIVDGEVVLADGQPTGFDAGEVQTAARRARERLW